MNRILVTCPCGDEFASTKERIACGRGKYCCRECFYSYRKRPSGLQYNIVKKNKGWFKKGQPSKWKGVPRPEFHKPDAGYDAIHEWVALWADDPEGFGRLSKALQEVSQ